MFYSATQKCELIIHEGSLTTCLDCFAPNLEIFLITPKGAVLNLQGCKRQFNE